VGPWTSWSHHNYTDIERERSGTKSANPNNFNLAADARNILISYGWAGYNPETGESVPAVWLTEGGTRWDTLRSLYGYTTNAQLEEAQRVSLNFQHENMEGPPDGVGMLLFMQYLFYTDPHPTGDAGLLYADQLPPSPPHYRSAYSNFAGWPNP
jgi:hypothetical protein